MSDKNTGFVQLLCTFMCIILCASIFLGSGRNFYTVVDNLYNRVAGVVDAFDVGGMTNHLNIKFVSSRVSYDSKGHDRYYLVFEYPSTLPRFVKNVNLFTRGTPSKYIAKFTSMNGVYHLDYIGTSRTNTYSQLNFFGFEKSEEDFVKDTEVLGSEDLSLLGLYDITFNGTNFYVECQFGSFCFRFLDHGAG